MHANPDVETVLRPKISRLEHTVVSQDEVIAGLTQELSDLKERYRVLQTRARVPEASPNRVPRLSPEIGGDEVAPDTGRVPLPTELVSTRQEVERLSRELDSLRDEKLTLVADLNLAVLTKEALVIEKTRLAAEKDAVLAERDAALAAKSTTLVERDAALAERDAALAAKKTVFAERDAALADKDRVLSDKGRILAEKDEVSVALGKAVSERELAEADKDQAVAERESALEKLEGMESRYQRIRRKYRHYKARVKRLSELLSFFPWLRTKAWAFGFHIGFENFRAFVLRSDRLRVSYESVSSNFLSLPSSCDSELMDLGIEYFLDVLDWSKDAPNPEDAPDGECSRDDDSGNDHPSGK
jgi:DNA repair exonuclease SbcCD ATPase subunit